MSPPPDQQMHRRQRETRGRDHGPDDRNPAHVPIFCRMGS
jgi:hypothetical protein